MADENRDEALELRPLTEDEADECSFYVDPLPDGLSLTQHKYYRWGDTAIIAVGELNYPNHWDDEDFEHTCNAVETALAATRPAPKADSALVGELRELADRAGIDLSNPMIWEPCGAEICDSEHGFQIASMASEIFPSNLDEANAELVSLLVNNLGNILAALSDRDVVLEEAAKVAWSDIDTAPKDGSWVILAKHGSRTNQGAGVMVCSNQPTGEQSQ